MVNEDFIHPIQFGRWILKHAETAQDENGLLCYKLTSGELIDTAELYELFVKNEL